MQIVEAECHINHIKEACKEEEIKASYKAEIHITLEDVFCILNAQVN